MPDTIVFDIEANGLLDTVSVIHCICTVNKATGERRKYHDHVDICPSSGSILDGLAYLSTAGELRGHNIQGYDLPALDKVHGWTYAGPIRDSLLCSRLIWTNLKEKDLVNWKLGRMPGQLIGRHGLKAWGYRMGILKGEFGAEQDQWETFSPAMLDYCSQDVEVTLSFDDLIDGKGYSKEAIELEHSFAAIIRKQEQFGFCFNEQEAVKIYAMLSHKRQEIKVGLTSVFAGWEHPMKSVQYWIGDDGNHYVTKKESKESGYKGNLRPGPLRVKAEPFNPSSRDHIARFFIEKYAWSPKLFGTDGKPTVDEAVLETLVYPEVKPLLEYLLIEKRIGMLAEGDNAWLKLVKGGRIHGEVITNGAVTGRCTHRTPNVAQVPACDALYGPDCRSLFGPPPGWVEVGCDASGLELRCLAHYMGHYDGGAYADVILNGDIHTVNQQAAGLPTRNNAKTFI